MPKLMTPYAQKLAKSSRKKAKQYEKTGPWIEAWRRLRRNRMAIAGLIILLILIVCAICPQLFVRPMGRMSRITRKPSNFRVCGIRSARTIWDATFSAGLSMEPECRW